MGYPRARSFLVESQNVTWACTTSLSSHQKLLRLQGQSGIFCKFHSQLTYNAIHVGRTYNCRTFCCICDTTADKGLDFAVPSFKSGEKLLVNLGRLQLILLKTETSVKYTLFNYLEASHVFLYMITDNKDHILQKGSAHLPSSSIHPAPSCSASSWPLPSCRC